MKEEKTKKKFALKWPWNLLVGVVVAAVLGWFIGYLWSILLVIGFFAIQRKHSPGMPEEGYCMARTRKRLKWLPLGIVLFLLGVAFLGAFLYSIHSKQPLETENKIGMLIGGPILLLLGLWYCWISIRDSFCPEKSTLAKSIRSQLPYPDEAPPVSELFAMVDNDLKENGQTFGAVMIGKEWVLGEMASYIPRIRAVFGRDEMVTRTHGGKNASTSRIVELHIIDDRNQRQVTDVRNPRELPMILNCLQLRAPDAYFGDYKELSAYQNVSDEEKEWREQDFQCRQSKRETQTLRKTKQPAQNVILIAANTAPTSIVNKEILCDILNSEYRKEGLSLTAGRPVEWNGVRYDTLWYTPKEEGGWLFLEERDPSKTDAESRQALRRWVQDDETALNVLLAWADGRIDRPEIWAESRLNGVGAIDLNHPPQVQEKSERPAELSLVTMEGVGQKHNTFTREDVEVAAEGIVDLTYQMVRYVKEGGWMLMTVENGNKSDGRCTVTVSRLVNNDLRFYRCKSTHRQAAEWFLAFYDGCFAPDWHEWKDVTQKLIK